MNVRILDTNTPSKEMHVCSDQGTQLIPDTSDYLFNLPSVIRCPYDEYMTLSVLNAEIPVSFYNVNSNNNVLRFKYESEDERTIQFTEGNYNINQLLSHLNDKLVAFSFTNSIIINWSSLSNKLSLSGTGDITLLPTSTCLQMLGFSDNIHKGSTVVSDGMIDIRGLTSVYVNTDLLDDTYHFNGSSNNFLHHTICRIPVNAGSYGTITYQPLEKTLCRVSRNVLGGAYRIYITDEKGKLINFNNMKWTITLKVDFHKIKKVENNIYNDSSSFYSNSRTYRNGGNLRNWINERYENL